MNTKRFERFVIVAIVLLPTAGALNKVSVASSGPSKTSSPVRLASIHGSRQFVTTVRRARISDGRWSAGSRTTWHSYQLTGSEGNFAFRLPQARFMATAFTQGEVSSLPDAGAQSGDYGLSLYGPRTLYPGYDSYVQLTVSYLGKIGHVYFNDFTAPKGINATVLCSSMPCWRRAGDSRIYQWNTSQKSMPVLLHFQTAADVAPGEYKVAVTTEVAGVVHSLDVPLRVLPVPVLKAGHGGSPPSIPRLGRWKEEMVKLGSKWCDPTKVYSFGWESDVWYYDGARVFFQIADYTHDNSWNACALNIAKQYAAYVISNKGSIPGWRVFPHGLRMAYERTGAEEYKQAAILLAQNSAFAGKGGSITDSRIRETAYVLQAYIQAEKLGQRRNPNLTKSADFLLGMFEVIFVQGPGAYYVHQAFFDGIAAAALIEYYQLTGDPRVPPMIKLMLDWIRNTAWNQTSHCLIWGPFDANASCRTELNNLVAPAFAWYYNVTGNAEPVYLTAGDEMFSHALDTAISYNGKIFSQNYRWSFDYVRWRSTP
jgi:hypothetical protein